MSSVSGAAAPGSTPGYIDRAQLKAEAKKLVKTELGRLLLEIADHVTP